MPLLDSQQIYDIIHKKLLHEEFQMENYTLTPIDVRGGMMGEHVKLTCVIYDKMLGRQSEHSFFVKRTDISGQYNDYAKEVFIKEKHAYAMFLSIDLPFINDSVAQCFYIDDTQIVLSDLVEEDYRLLSGQGASEAELHVILKSLAGIHAGGIIYEEQQRQETGDPEYTLKSAFPEAFRDVFLTSKVPSSSIFHAAFIKGVVTSLEMFDMPKTLSNGKSFADQAQMLWRLKELSPLKNHRNTVSHCDLWYGNVFVKRSNGISTHIKFIDYQTIRYLPPALDVLLAIYLNTNQDYRRDHIDVLLRDYFAHFNECFRKHRIDPDGICTFAKFMESICEMKFYAIALYCTIIHCAALDQNEYDGLVKSGEWEEIVMTDRSNLLKKYKDDEFYMDRCKDSILELKDFFEKSSTPTSVQNTVK